MHKQEQCRKIWKQLGRDICTRSIRRCVWTEGDEDGNDEGLWEDESD